MRSDPTKFRQFFDWLRSTLDFLCNSPNHLQRLSIIAAGMSLYPLFIGMIGLLSWMASSYQDQRVLIIGGLINFGYIFLGLFGLVILSLLGTIKGVRLGPSGIEVTTTADDDENDSPKDAYGGESPQDAPTIEVDEIKDPETVSA